LGANARRRQEFRGRRSLNCCDGRAWGKRAPAQRQQRCCGDGGGYQRSGREDVFAAHHPDDNGIGMHAPRPTLRSLSALVFRLVNFTFGGGDPTMAALEREMVHRRKWLDPEKYGLSFALARITPGTNVIAFSAAVAWFLRGWPGAVAAVVAGTVPCAVLVVWLTYGYQHLKDSPAARAAIAGMLAAAVGMMFAAAWNLIRPEVRRGRWLRAAVLAGGAAVLVARFAVAPIQVLALAALIGFAWHNPEDQ
jgi:chromate transporter